MANIIRIEVELDSAGAVAGVRKLGDEVRNLPAAGAAASKATRELSAEQQKATQTAQLLASRLGIELPRSVATWITGLKGVAPALSMAFSASAVVALGLALFEAGKRLYEFIDGSKAAAEQAAKNKKAHEEQTKTLKEYADQLERIRLENERRGKTGAILTATQVTQAAAPLEELELKRALLQSAIDKLQAQMAGLTWKGEKIGPSVTDIKRLQDMRNELEKINLQLGVAAETAKGFVAQLGMDRAEEGKKRLDELNKTLWDQVVALRALHKEEAPAEVGALIRTGIQPLPEAPDRGRYFDDLMKGYLKTAGDAIAATDALRKANDELALSLGKRGASAQEALALELAALDAEKAKYKDNADAIEEIERRKGLLIRQTNLQIAEDAKSALERQANDIESFFDRVFLTARSFGDVWRQLWTQCVSFVVKQLAHLVAGWIAARNQMGQAVGIGGGGTAGSTAGGVLSTVGALIPGLTGQTYGGAYAGAGAVGATGGYNLNQLPGWGAGAFVGPTLDMLGTSGSGAIKGQAFFTNLKGMAPALATAIGLSLAGYGVSQGKVWQGVAGGALAGWGAGSMAAAYLPAAFGPWAGPIGAAVGAVIAWVLAARRRGQQKTQSAKILEEYLEAAKQVVAQYEIHKVSYESAISSLAGMQEQAVAALGNLGAPGERTVDQVTSYYRSAVSRINALEKVRQQRSEVIAGLPVPEYQAGSQGIIRSGGAFPAILHLGEAVLNARAAAQLGDQNIKALNQGQGSMPGEVKIQMVFPGVTDPRGFEAALKKNMGTVIKLVRQAAVDRGLPAPV